MDRISKETRSRIMANIRSKSGIERLPDGLRGFYLRSHPQGIIGHPDFGNKARRIAIFIDGCFWHGCPKHYREPKSNIPYWIPKMERNKARDIEVNAKLQMEGWKVIRIWEHQLP